MNRYWRARHWLARAAIVVAVLSASPVITFAADAIDAMAGKALFDRLWVPAPASTDASDGLGPLFTSRACAACHRDAGGARVKTDPSGRSDVIGAVVRFGSATGDIDPNYGLQLQTHAIPGFATEGQAQFLPSLQLQVLGPPLSADTRTSVRLAPSLLGRAAFDAISDAEILKRADPEDVNGDGISGRANSVAGRIGRYGWKAAHATLSVQIAHALMIDLGLSSPAMARPHGDCTVAQTQCLRAVTGESAALDGREVSQTMVELITLYLDSLKPPTAVGNEKGATAFAQAGCPACHVPSLEHPTLGAIPAYTDLLLHDLGAPNDDGVGEPGVTSSEWRTAPLIGNADREENRRYLHDGSAATIEDAVARHGGEASTSRTAFGNLSRDDKSRLIEFVKGL